MTDKIKLFVIAFSLIISFAVGRYSAQKPNVQESVKTDETKNTAIDVDTHTVIVHLPDGSTTTTIDKSRKQNITDVSKTASVISIESVKPQVQLSLLGGYDTKNNASVLGASVSKQMLGPITIGAFGLSSGVVGLSLGVVF